MELTILAGGVGAARFLSGLVRAVPSESVTVVINTGDDFVLYGLCISPDIDIVTYTLAEIVHPIQGWGIADDSFKCLSMMERLGHPTWFNLGDQDIGTHLHRTLRLNQGYSLSQVTEEIRTALGVKSRLLPMSNELVRTHIQTGNELIPFQEYLVRRKGRDSVREIVFVGIEQALPAPGVIASLHHASGIIIAPSNPFVSIGTILAVPGIRAVLQKSEAPVIAISPIVGGAAIKGPAAQMMRGLGYEVSPLGIARLYQDILDVLVIDRVDSDLEEIIRELGIRVFVADTIMETEEKKVNLARTILNILKG